MDRIVGSVHAHYERVGLCALATVWLVIGGASYWLADTPRWTVLLNGAWFQLAGLLTAAFAASPHVTWLWRWAAATTFTACLGRALFIPVWKAPVDPDWIAKSVVGGAVYVALAGLSLSFWHREVAQLRSYWQGRRNGQATAAEVDRGGGTGCS